MFLKLCFYHFAQIIQLIDKFVPGQCRLILIFVRNFWRRVVGRGRIIFWQLLWSFQLLVHDVLFFGNIRVFYVLWYTQSGSRKDFIFDRVKCSELLQILGFFKLVWLFCTTENLLKSYKNISNLWLDIFQYSSLFPHNCLCFFMLLVRMNERQFLHLEMVLLLTFKLYLLVLYELTQHSQFLLLPL